jgi:hypothetical protein
MADVSKEILVVPGSAPTIDEKGVRGIFGPNPGPVQLNTELLRANLANFIETINEMLSKIPRVTEPFKLDEIELTVEINGEGNIQLIGGLKVGASGGITLKMKR